MDSMWMSSCLLHRIMHVIIRRSTVAEHCACALASGGAISDRAITIEQTGLPPDTAFEAEVLAGPGLEDYYVYRVSHPSFAEVPEGCMVPEWNWLGSPNVTWRSDLGWHLDPIVLTRRFESVSHLCTLMQEGEAEDA